MEVSEEEKRKLRKVLAESVLNVSTLSEMFGKSSGAFGLARHISDKTPSVFTLGVYVVRPWLRETDKRELASCSDVRADPRYHVWPQSSR